MLASLFLPVSKILNYELGFIGFQSLSAKPQAAGKPLGP